MIKPIYDEQSYQHQNPTNIVQSIGGSFNVGNSTLVLISPRDMKDHYKRPYVYNFNNEVVDSVAQRIVSEPSASNSVRGVMNSIPSINHSIIPDTYGFDIATSAYSHNWSFVFMIDDHDNVSIPLQNDNITVRRIYIGICTEEPILQMGLHSATPERYINPNCLLVITRQMMLKKIKSYAHNTPREIVKSMVNENVIQFNANLWGDRNSPQNNNNFYTIVPEEIHNNVVYGDGQLMSVNDHSKSLNNVGSTTVNATMESPRHHMSNILTAIESSSQSVGFCGRVGDFNESPVSDNGFQLDTTLATFESYFHSALGSQRYHNCAKSQDCMGDMFSGHLTIGMLTGQYSPKIIPIIIPQTQNFDIIPQRSISINNVFSSMVCSVIPSYLTNTNLSEVAFMYNSYNDAISVQHIGSATSVGNDELHIAWKSFEYLLRTDLFPVLKHNGGEFDLQVMSVINGTTNIVLNFLDCEMLPIGAVYQENTNLGGIVSSLVGTSHHVDTNATRLNDLVRNVGSFAKIY